MSASSCASSFTRCLSVDNSVVSENILASRMAITEANTRLLGERKPSSWDIAEANWGKIAIMSNAAASRIQKSESSIWMRFLRMFVVMKMNVMAAPAKQRILTISDIVAPSSYRNHWNISIEKHVRAI